MTDGHHLNAVKTQSL